MDELAINSINPGKYLYLKSFANHMSIYNNETDPILNKTGYEKKMVPNLSVPMSLNNESTSKEQADLE